MDWCFSHWFSRSMSTSWIQSTFCTCWNHLWSFCPLQFVIGLGGHLGQHNVMGGEPRAFVGKRGTDCMCILVLHSLCHFKGFLVCFDFLICQGRGTALPSMTYTESPKPVTRRLTTCFENASPDTVQVVVLSSSHIWAEPARFGRVQWTLWSNHVLLDSPRKSRSLALSGWPRCAGYAALHWWQREQIPWWHQHATKLSTCLAMSPHPLIILIHLIPYFCLLLLELKRKRRKWQKWWK
jgi:hypothetical protein